MLKYIWNTFLNKQVKLLFLIQICLLAVGSFLGVYPVMLIRKVVDLAVYGKKENISLIISFSCLYLLLQVIHVILVGVSSFLSKYMQAKITYVLQKNVFGHINRVKLQGIKFSDSAKISSTLIQDTQFLSENIVEPFTGVISSILTFVFGVYYVSSINVYLVLLVLPLGLISSLIIKWVSRKSYLNLASQREISTKLWKTFNEGIQGFIPLRLHGSIDKYFEKVDLQGGLLQKTSIKQGRIESVSKGITSSLFMITIGLIMMISSVFTVMGKMTLGGLTAIMMYNHMLSDPLIHIQEISHKIQRLKVSFSRIYELMKLPSDHDGKKTAEIDEIELSNAEFGFNEHEVLKGINLHIYKGDSLVIAGATGSGKTTLANVLSGIYDSTGGEVIFRNNNTIVYAKPKISYMLQDEYIFDDTVMNNILVGNYNLQKEKLETIIRLSELEEVIKNHKTTVGDKGILLSGGERKRVLIARTLADCNADIFIFDEMSASLDHDTFIRIWHNVDKYLDDKIRIYIEHDLSVQESVDKVVFMNT